MTDIRNGELLDLLRNSSFFTETEVIALSYALKVGTDMVLHYADGTMTQSKISDVSESTLDALAVELRTPYYTQDMDVETKRQMVEKTLQWHYKAGTVAAVQEMVTTIFGKGEVVEWFNFTEGTQAPGMFDIITNAQMTEDMVEEFLKIVERVKNVRSHIRRILIERSAELTEYTAGGGRTAPKSNIFNHSNKEHHPFVPDYRGMGGISHPATRTSTHSEKKRRAGCAPYYAASCISHPKTTV